MDYPTACWRCQHYRGLTGQGTAARCGRQDGSRVRSGPHTGCAEFTEDPTAPLGPPPDWDPPGRHVELVSGLRRS